VSDLADFLRARYAERRSLAEAASPGPWRPNEDGDEVLAVDGLTVADGFALSGRQLRATVDHIAANDPSAVIADCDIKLRIINEVVPEIDAMDDRIDGEWGVGDPTERESMTLLRLLAQPFAGHPDHKGEEWAP
jgi:hypothetical protein